METLVAEHREEIAALCREFNVLRLEVFGSSVNGEFDLDRSDVDFLVEFQPLAEGRHADAYFGLLESLVSLLQRPIDLVMAGAIRNRYFLEAIDQSRTEIYAA